MTFADWITHELTPDGDHRQVSEPAGSSLLDSALASAAHPVAFVPQSLDRSGDLDTYRRRGIENAPEHGTMWYSDGGLVETRPIGRIISAAQQRAGQSAGLRLHLVVDPRSSGPSGNEEWATTVTPKSWLEGLRRAVSVVPTQSLHDDLRSIASANERLELLDDLVERLTPELDSVDESELRRALAEIGDLEDKERVDVDMITPLFRVDDDAGVNDLLAGDFIGAFGGFLDRSIRRSDFALGWRSAKNWMSVGLAQHAIVDDHIESVLADLTAYEVENDVDETDQEGASGDGVEQLDRAGRWQLALLGLQFGRVILGEAIPWPPRFVERFRSGS